MDAIKNLFLAAVGGTRLTYEKAEEVLTNLIEKGQISVAEGKALSEDIKRVTKNQKDGKTSDDQLEQTLSERILGLQTQVEALSQEVSQLKTGQVLESDNQEADNTEA